MLTDQFLTDQLIPYIGNKRRLLAMLRAAIESTGKRNGVFCDLFAGSGVVSRLAKRMGFEVVSNDWEPYSFTINQAYIQTNRPPAFERLGGMDEAFATLNSLEPIKGYIARHFCPEDDENPDVERERMFYTQTNGQRIDAIREQIEEWSLSGKINEQEEAVLLSPLIYQGAYCSNTSGVFKGFHRGWGGSTSTALYRIRSQLSLTSPIFYDNGCKNQAVCGDALELAAGIRCDTAYIDPPYNQHQYGSNYHLLNSIALWDKPKVSRYIGIGPEPCGKSAIRTDWRTKRRSPFCYKSTAESAFSELMARIRASYVLISYSTDGIIPASALLNAAAKRGRVNIVIRHYKRYRVSSQRPSPRSHTVEYVAVVDTSVGSDAASGRRAVDTVERALVSDSRNGEEMK